MPTIEQDCKRYCTLLQRILDLKDNESRFRDFMEATLEASEIEHDRANDAEFWNAVNAALEKAD